jgi:hypothetical protein
LRGTSSQVPTVEFAVAPAAEVGEWHGLTSILWLVLFGLVLIGLMVTNFWFLGRLVESGRMRWYMWPLSFTLLALAFWLSWEGLRAALRA